MESQCDRCYINKQKNILAEYKKLGTPYEIKEKLREYNKIAEAITLGKIVRVKERSREHTNK